MALRRADLVALSGFEVAKDVLAEDYVIGVMVGERLGRRVEIGRRPIRNEATEWHPASTLPQPGATP